MKLSKRMFNFFLFYFYLIYFILSYENIDSVFKCNVDSIKPIPKFANKILPLNPKTNYRRSLDSDGFKSFNIKLDLENFNDEIELYNLEDKRELFITGMNYAKKTLETLLKVKQPRNFAFTDEQLIRLSIYNWNKYLIGNKTDKGMTDFGIDLFIFVRFGNNSEMGRRTLASASARYIDPDNGQP